MEDLRKHPLLKVCSSKMFGSDRWRHNKKCESVSISISKSIEYSYYLFTSFYLKPHHIVACFFFIFSFLRSYHFIRCCILSCHIFSIHHCFLRLVFTSPFSSYLGTLEGFYKNFSTWSSSSWIKGEKGTWLFNFPDQMVRISEYSKDFSED